MATEKDSPKKAKKEADGEGKLHEKKAPEPVPIQKPSFLWEGPPALVVVGGQGLTIGSRLNLAPGVTVLGRSPDADIPILDGSMSRRHVELTVSEGGDCIAKDLESRHGSFVNDRPMREPALLTDGDYLRCGNVVLKFRTAKGAPATAKPAAPEKKEKKAPPPPEPEPEMKSDKRPISPRPAAQREETTARGGAKTKAPAPPAEEPTVPIPSKK